MNSVSYAISVMLAYVPVGIEGQPLGLEDAYLAYHTNSLADSIAISSTQDSSDAVLTNFVEFPGMFNAAKAWAVYNRYTGMLTITSEYPGTSTRAIAEYYLEENGYLYLVNSWVLDQYAQHLELMEDAAVEGNFQAAVGEVYEMFYPGNCTYKAEMGIVFLYSLIYEADRQVDEGCTMEDLMNLHYEAYEAARYIFLPDLHSMILEAERYPETALVTLPEYINLLKRYGSLLRFLNDEVEQESVMEVISGLTD